MLDPKTANPLQDMRTARTRNRKAGGLEQAIGRGSAEAR